MKKNQIETLIEQVCCDSVIEIECPVCEASIVAEPDATDLYCQDCKMIVMQNPLTKLGLI